VGQLLAIVWLRFKLLARSARGETGTLNLVVALVTGLFGVVIACGLAAGFGALAFYSARTGDLPGIRAAYLVIFYSFAFFGLVLPVLTGAMGHGFDAASLRVYPISRARLFLIGLAAGGASAEHLIYYPALAAVYGAGVLAGGADPLLGTLALLLLLLFYVTWGNVLTLGLVSLMRRRRAREIVILVGLIAIIAATVLPALLVDPRREKLGADVIPMLAPLIDGLAAAGQILAPTLAADALTALHDGAPSTALAYVGGLLLWSLCGIALGYYVFSRHYLGDGGGRRAATGGGTARANAETSWGPFCLDRGLFARLPGETRALAGKDLRYLFRSVLGKFNLAMMPVLVLLVAFVFARNIENAMWGFDPRQLAFYGLLLYGTVLSNNFVNNAYAWEGRGAQIYFSTPADPARIIAGKNLAVALFNLVLLAICLACWSLLAGPPDLETLITGVLLYGFSVLAFTTWGNLVSVVFPVRRDIAAINNTPSHVAIVLALVILVANAVLAACAMLLPDWLGLPIPRPLSLAALVALQAWLYVLMLGRAGRLLARRKEAFLARLATER